MERRDATAVFFRLFEADQWCPAGPRSREEYLALFPGCEDAIADALRQVVSGEPEAAVFPTGDPTPPFAPAVIGLSPGTRLKDCVIESRLGHGGQGTVYRAFQESMNRVVAVKTLMQGRYRSADDVAALAREAKALGSLRHPSICTVHTLEVDKGIPFIVMELVEGRNLAAVIDERHFPEERSATSSAARGGRAGEAGPDGYRFPDPRECANQVAVLADALGVAHRCEPPIVHQDVKPSNVMLRAEGGEPVLVDFGLAGVRGGTPRYKSPEQILGGPVDHRSDVFSLGIVLHEWLTGRHPFAEGDDAALTIQEAIVTREPQRLRPVARLFDADLEAILQKALAPARADRYPDMDAFRDDLRAYVEHRPVSVRRPRLHQRLRKWVRREPGVVRVLALVFVALLAFALYENRGRRKLDRVYKLASGLIETTGAVGSGNVPLAKRIDIQRERVEALRVIAAETGEHDRWNPEIANAQQLLGDLLYQSNDLDETGRIRRDTLALREAMSGLPDPSLELERSLAVAIIHVGDVEKDLEHSLEAESLYRRAHVVVEALARRRPEAIPFVVDLVFSHVRLADIAQGIGDEALQHREAEAAYTLARELPAEGNAAAASARYYAAAAIQQSAANDQDRERRERFDLEKFDAARNASEADPGSAELRRLYERIQGVHLIHTAEMEGKVAHEHGLKMTAAQRLADRPEYLVSTLDVVDATTTASESWSQEGDFVRADLEAAEAIAIAKRACEFAPRSVAARFSLAAAQRYRADAAFDRGNEALAADEFAGVLATLEGTASTFPSIRTLSEFASLLASCKVLRLRDPTRGLALATRAFEMSQRRSVRALATVVDASSGLGRFAEAAEHAGLMLAMLPPHGCPRRTGVERLRESLLARARAGR